MSGEAKKQPEDKATPPPAATSGFHAQLEGASLWDLVQLECLARSHLCVEVTGEGGAGYLYFDGGRVVHAMTQRQRGAAAALEILGWTHGTFQASRRAWPMGAPTIDMTHESLLLHAAKKQDEERASNLVAFPGRAIDAAVDDVELYEIEEEGGAEMRSPDPEDTPSPAPPSLPRPEASADFPVMVRLSAGGAVLRNRGGTDEFAEATAYAHRLVQLTGDLLGLEGFTGVECVFTEGRCLIFNEGDGDVVALRPRADLNLQALRERLGL